MTDIQARKITEVYESINEKKKNAVFLPTGFPSIDFMLDGGFLKKEMIVLGGRTGSGKSFVAGTLFYNIAKSGFKCAYFSLEISSEMVLSRLIGSIANIQPTHILMKEVDKETQKKIMKAKGEISVYEEFITLYDTVRKFEDIQREIHENQYDFVVIDFIQNISVQGKEEYERLSYLAHSFQEMSIKENCCSLIVSQLSNSIAKDKRDDVIEYKGSGEIGIVCDLGFFIEKGSTGEGSFALKLRKNRRGVTGTSFNFALVSPGGRVVQV